ncbi:RNA helicase [Balamuthia mandrillaris]
MWQQGLRYGRPLGSGGGSSSCVGGIGITPSPLSSLLFRRRGTGWRKGFGAGERTATSYRCAALQGIMGGASSRVLASAFVFSRAPTVSHVRAPLASRRHVIQQGIRCLSSFEAPPQLIKVLFNGEELKFRVPRDQHYTFSDLLRDSAAHWQLGGDELLSLVDEELGCQWPPSAKLHEELKARNNTNRNSDAADLFVVRLVKKEQQQPQRRERRTAMQRVLSGISLGEKEGEGMEEEEEEEGEEEGEGDAEEEEEEEMKMEKETLKFLMCMDGAKSSDQLRQMQKDLEDEEDEEDEEYEEEEEEEGEEEDEVIEAAEVEEEELVPDGWGGLMKASQRKSTISVSVKPAYGKEGAVGASTRIIPNFTKEEQVYLEKRFKQFSQSAEVTVELERTFTTHDMSRFLRQPGAQERILRDFKRSVLFSTSNTIPNAYPSLFPVEDEWSPEPFKHLLLDRSLSDEEWIDSVLPSFIEFVGSKYASRPFIGKETSQTTQMLRRVSLLSSTESDVMDGEVKTLSSRVLRRRMMDLRLPHEWYPAARKQKRKVILHMGPTNSGKTYTALKRLAESKSGLYCGPLRLLAEEVYDKLNTQARVPCNLVTGQRILETDDAKHVSCTVEMADTSRQVECAVIDEIQMIGDKSRGWAWSRAFLGIPANEIHLCGNESALSLIQQMCSVSGDELEIRTYERLSPLESKVSHLGKSLFSKLRPGDCLIAFSRTKLHRLKKDVESNTKYRCCIVYGGLPPSTRVEQAQLFNDPTSPYEILVASDAIGMGLNLNIRRIIFTAAEKFDGETLRDLTPAEIKQIGGRAGRFKSKYPVGVVACVHRGDAPLIQDALASNLEQLDRAGLAPTYEQLVAYSQVFPDLSFAEVLEMFYEDATVDKNYFVCGNEDSVAAAALLEEVPLSLRERYIFSSCPVNSDDTALMYHLLLFAQHHALKGEVKMNLRLNPKKLSRAPQERLSDLETFYNVLDLYIWLSYRFTTFTERNKANAMKEKVSDMINDILEQSSIKSSRAHRKKGGEKKRKYSVESKKKYFKSLSRLMRA